MIGLIQRVKHASVTVGAHKVSTIGQGILLLLGVEKADGVTQIEKLAKKVTHYRIFADDEGKMNKSLLDISGELLVVSQFTLVAQTDKGNRPGFSGGANPEHGKFIYDEFVTHIRQQYLNCQTGEYGQDMQVSLINDGPATFYFKV
ncbi:D-aminoacyl-tRNA deacylase [Ningiella sp. W23]|uniref:D-aminoacyl-tRNA deacylase n=1 Tax=Ningiella sp. W23 TaxID=3023715 RepID=UPI003757DF7E